MTEALKNVELRWVRRASEINIKSGPMKDQIFTKEENVLQYRVQREPGFRGWSEWMDVPREGETTK